MIWFYTNHELEFPVYADETDEVVDNDEFKNEFEVSDETGNTT